MKTVNFDEIILSKGKYRTSSQISIVARQEKAETVPTARDWRQMFVHSI